MGKRKHQTQIDIIGNNKHKKVNKTRSYNRITSFSSSDIATSKETRNVKILRNVQRALRKISNRSKQDNKKRLMSALNIASQNQIVCSAINIPSIQNLLVSKNDLAQFKGYDEALSQSGVSFNGQMSFFLLQSEPDLMISYVCLVEKALNKLGIVLSSDQNQKLLMGVWNLLIKFWTDDDQQNQYFNLNTKIEWGLLQLLNYDLKVGHKQRIIMQNKISSFSVLQK